MKVLYGCAAALVCWIGYKSQKASYAFYDTRIAGFKNIVVKESAALAAKENQAATAKAAEKLRA